jgi:hypothetical protein
LDKKDLKPGDIYAENMAEAHIITNEVAMSMLQYLAKKGILTTDFLTTLELRIKQRLDNARTTGSDSVTQEFTISDE